MGIKVFKTLPKGFVSTMSIAGCYCLCNERFLLLKRSPNCPAGGSWCLPGGKQEGEESLRACARRELFEEVGVDLSIDHLRPLTTLYLDRGAAKYDFAIYLCLFKALPPLHLRIEEHTEARWVTHQEAGQLPLIHGGPTVLAHCFHIQQLSS